MSRTRGEGRAPIDPTTILERHVRRRVTDVEQALEADLATVAATAWAVLGSGRALPSIVRTSFHGYGSDTGRGGLLGAFDHLEHTVRLNVRALAVGALLRDHPPAARPDPCWTELAEELHPAAIVEPLAMTLIHELVHAATWREEVAPGPEGGAPGNVRWPLYEQTMWRRGGRVVGSPVDPRRRALLEGMTDARAAQVFLTIVPSIPAWLAEPAPGVVRTGHPRARLAIYGARPVVERICTQAEIETLLDGPVEWDALCARALARMREEEAIVARGWLDGELDRFVSDAGLPEDHAFRRIGWRSIAVWIELGDGARAAAA